MISPSDPCSAWTAKANKRVQFGYGLNYLIDIENAVIVDVEATPARTYDEVAATKTMIDRTAKCFDLKPKRLAADTAYGTGKFLDWLAGEKITPHIPVWDRSAREDGTYSRKACKTAGIVGVTFNDLRGTAVTRLALAECTEAEMATITGHTLRDVRSILDANYLHRDPALAEAAIKKLEARTKTPDQAPDCA